MADAGQDDQSVVHFFPDSEWITIETRPASSAAAAAATTTTIPSHSPATKSGEALLNETSAGSRFSVHSRSVLSNSGMAVSNSGSPVHTTREPLSTAVTGTPPPRVRMPLHTTSPAPRPWVGQESPAGWSSAAPAHAPEAHSAEDQQHSIAVPRTDFATTSNPSTRQLHKASDLVSGHLKLLGSWEQAASGKRLHAWLEALERTIRIVEGSSDAQQALLFVGAWLRMNVPNTVIDTTARHHDLEYAHPREWVRVLREVVPELRPNYAKLFSVAYKSGQSQSYFEALRAAIPGKSFDETLYKQALIRGLPREVRAWVYSSLPMATESASASAVETQIRAYEQKILWPTVAEDAAGVTLSVAALDALYDGDEEFETAAEVAAVGLQSQRPGAVRTAGTPQMTNLNMQPTTAEAASELAMALRRRANELIRTHNLCARCTRSGHTFEQCPAMRTWRARSGASSASVPPPTPATPTPTTTGAGNPPSGVGVRQ